MSIQEIETAIVGLPPAELEEFSRWFEEYLADRWDQQIAADVVAGRLDALGRQADEQFESGQCAPL